MEEYYEIHQTDSIFSSDIKLFRFLKELLLKDYKIYEMTQRTGDLVPYHTHACKEIIIITEGNMRMIIEEHIIDLKEGDVITIKPWAIHLACFPVKNGASFYLCHPMKNAPPQP